jgi:hypothetical protein
VIGIHHEFDLTYGAVGPEGLAGPEGPQGPEGASPWLLTNDGLIHTSTNVGIGTTNPHERLDISDSDNNSAIRFRPTAVGPKLIYKAHRGGTKDLHVLFEDAGGAQTEVVKIKGNANTGNFGIGTMDPTTKLDVAATIRSSTGGIMFPDGTVQTTAAATGECTKHYFVTTRILIDDAGTEYPLPFCPSGWTIESHWINKAAGWDSGNAGEDQRVYNTQRQTLCGKCE